MPSSVLVCRMYYHCPPPFIEHPQLFVDALASQDVMFAFDGCSHRLRGNVEGADLCLWLRPDRFRANVVIRYPSGRPVWHPLDEAGIRQFISLKQRAIARELAKGCSEEVAERNLKSFFTMLDHNEASCRIVSTLRAIGCDEVRSPLKEELRYIAETFAATPLIDALVAQVHYCEQSIQAYLTCAGFQVTACFAKKRRQAMAQLHQVCLTGSYDPALRVGPDSFNESIF